MADQPGIDVIIRAQTSAAQAALNQFTGAASGILGRLGAQLAAVFSVGMMVRWIKGAIDAADAMGQMAQKTGIAVEALSAWAYAAELADVNSGELQGALRTLATEMQRNGEGAQDIEQKLFALADRFAAMPDGVQKTALAVEKFGRAGQDMIPLLNQGSEALRRQMEEAKRFGKVIDADTAKAADEFKDSLTKLKAILDGMALSIGTLVLPGLKDFAEFVVSTIADINRHSGAVWAVTRAYQAMATGVVLAKAGLEVMWRTSGIGMVMGQGISLDRLQALRAEMDVSFKQIAAFGQNRSDILTPAGRGIRSGGSTGTQDNKQEIFELQKRLAQVQSVRSSFETEHDLGGRKRALEEERRAVGDLISEYARMSQDQSRTQEERNQAEMEFIRLQQEGFELQQEIDSYNFFGRMKQTIREIAAEIGSTTEIIARNFKTFIGGAIDALANGISGLIQGTLTWGNALRQIGSSIMTAIISSIARMFAQWIVGRLAVKAVEVASSAAEAAAKAPSALMSSIASYGTATIVGIALFLAALGVGIAAAAGAFAGGGLVKGQGGAKSDNILARLSNGEYVIPAGAVQAYGAAYFDQFRSPSAASQPTSGSAAAAAQSRPRLNFGFFDNRSEMRDWAYSQEGETVILDVVGRNKHRFA